MDRMRTFSNIPRYETRRSPKNLVVLRHTEHPSRLLHSCMDRELIHIEPTSRDPLYSKMMAQSDCTEIDHLHGDDDDDVSFSETIRRKAMSFIKRNRMFSKDKVHMQDAVSLVLILFQLDRLHLHSDPEDFQDNCFFGVEKTTKKVNQLVLQKASTSCFPLESISSLEALEDLKLYNVNIRSLITPNTDQYDGLQIHRQTLHNVKNLDVSFLMKEGEETVLETRCFHLLPKLESIMFRIFTSRTEKLYFRDVFNDLGSKFCACQKTLRSINLSHSMLTEEELKNLLVNVVPKLDSLVTINASANKIASVQQIAACINNNRSIANDSLQVLDLSWNAIVRNVENDPREREALMTVLTAFKGLYNIGDNFNLIDYGPAMKYQLQINHAGRRLVEDSSLSNKPILTSLMPFVFERAYQKSRDIHPSFRRSDREKDATGIYYLLHSEPVLRGYLRNPESGNNGAALSKRKYKRRKTSSHSYE